MSKSCLACSMPLLKKEDFAGGNMNADFCAHCANADGSVKSCAEIFEGGARFFMGITGVDRVLAEKVTRKNMLGLPYWNGKDITGILKGETATDAEFSGVMKKLI